MNKASLKAKGIEPISERELEKRYHDMLNEAFEPVNICGYEYDAGDALIRVDSTAYNVGYADWLSNELDETLIKIDGEYYDIWELNSIDSDESEAV